MLTPKEKRDREKSSSTTTICVIVAVAILAYFILVLDRMFLGILVVMLSIIPIILIANGIEHLARAPERKEEKKFLFYEDCRKSGIRSIRSEKDRGRVEIIAKQHGFEKVRNLEKFFEECKELAEDYTARLERETAHEQFKELREAETKELVELTKYADLSDNNKTIWILKEELQVFRRRKDFMLNLPQNASKLLMEKEKDWAIAGGIADGIAGPFAGMAVALETQAENERIRARNAQTQEQINQAAVYAMVHAHDHDEKIEELERLIAKEQRKLIGKMTPEDVLSYLVFGTPSCKVTDSGAVRICVDVICKGKPIIYGDTEAVVDGTVCADVWQNGILLGTAKLVLPRGGIRVGEMQSLNGLLLCRASKNLPCTVTYSAEHLYAIER